MLKASLPSQSEITSLYREVEALRRDKKLKDDTIKFLQKEKEAMQRELKDYEAVCDGTPGELTQYKIAEAEIRQLKDDILHLKDVIRRQNALLRSTGTSGSTALDRQLVTRLCGNLIGLLQDSSTPMGDQICAEIQNQKEQLERASSKRGEMTWHLIEVVDRALIELKSVQVLQRRKDLPDLPNLRITQQPNPPSLPFGSLRPSSSTSGSTRRMARSRSAPAINGIMPRPPSSAPPPSALKGIYQSNQSSSGRSSNQPMTTLSVHPPITASVNMLESMRPHPPAHSQA